MTKSNLNEEPSIPLLWPSLIEDLLMQNCDLEVPQIMSPMIDNIHSPINDLDISYCDKDEHSIADVIIDIGNNDMIKYLIMQVAICSSVGSVVTNDFSS